MEAEGDHVEIRFRRGQTHALHEEIHIRNDDITITAYGSGSKPKVEWRGEHTWTKSMVFMHGSADGTVVRGLTLTNRGVQHTGKMIANGIVPAGTNITIQDNTFLDVSSAILGSSNPSGMLVQGNDAPSETGVRAYFIWGQGDRMTVLGNTAVNSTREHIIRLARGIEGVTISGNDFDNIDRRNKGSQSDQWDTAKGTLVVQHGSYAYVANNTLRGVSGVGPLGDADGLSHKQDRWEYAVFEYNDHRDDAGFIVEHGAEHVDVRFNRINVENYHAITVEGFDSAYGRTVVDLTVHGNLITNTGTRGGMIKSWGGSEGLRLTDNVYVAPNLEVGAYGAAAFSHQDNDLSEYEAINGNVWPAATPGGWAEGGVNWIGTGDSRSNFMDESEWDNTYGVGDDDFYDANADAVYTIMLDNLGLSRLGA